NVEEHATVWRAAAFPYFTHNTSRNVVAGEQFRRPFCILVSLGVAPSLLFIGRCLGTVQFGYVVEHKTPAVLVTQDPSFSPYSFRDQESPNTWRPDHPGGMKLDELHVDEFSACIPGKCHAAACTIPTVARYFVEASHPPGGQYDRLCLEDLERASLPFITEGAGDSAVVLQRVCDCILLVEVYPLMSTMIRQSTNPFQTNSHTYAYQTRKLMSPEVPLQNTSVVRSVK